MRVYNTLTRQKEALVPLEEGKLNIYCCGPTVYDYIHLGNARPLVVFDLLRRHLEAKGYALNFAQNFTDIEDKIIRRAQEEQRPFHEITERFIAAYREDAAALGVRPADIEPRATEHIDEIQAMIDCLIAEGHAYVADDGVYFDPRSFPDYGSLSGFDLDELEADAGGRETGSEHKRAGIDFALWKLHKPGEPAWDSPWGPGRPGWHIECSAMVRRHLGETIDIHCGGVDLIFPHHENEIAQSECCTGQTLARYWMHNGHINVDQTKMSKSKGNFFTVRDLLERYSGMTLRFFILSIHYRHPINFSAEQLDAAAAGWSRVTTCIRNLRFRLEALETQAPSTTGDGEAVAEAADTDWASYRRRFDAALDDDLNSADALAAVFELVRALNAYSARPEAERSVLGAGLEQLLALLEVLGLDPDAEAAEDEGTPQAILDLVEARREARAARDWARADELRDAIQAQGWLIEDTPQGAKVYRA